MKDSHGIVKEMTFEAIIKTLIEDNPTDKKPNPTNSKSDNSAYLLIGILFFVGAEAISVTFRKNFGREGLNMAMIITASLCFAGIAAWSFNTYLSSSTSENSDSLSSFLITGLLFSAIAIIILISGIHQCRKANSINPDSDFRGDSFLLSFLKKDGWNNSQIIYIAEPCLILCCGISLYFYNHIGGIALIACAISVWGRAIIEEMILGNFVTRKINEESIFKAKPTNRVN